MRVPPDAIGRVVAAAFLTRPKPAATISSSMPESSGVTIVASVQSPAAGETRAGQTTRVAAADSFRDAARISSALTSSARLFAAPSETRIA